MEYFDGRLKKAVEEKYNNLSEIEKADYIEKHKQWNKKTNRNYLIGSALVAFFISLIIFFVAIVRIGAPSKMLIYWILVFFGFILLFDLPLLLVMPFMLKKDEDKIKFMLERELKEIVKEQMSNEEKDKSILLRQEFGDSFVFSRDLPLCYGKNMLIDNVNKQFVLYVNHKFLQVHKYSEVINYEVYENGSSVVKGTAGEALIGGAFFGLTGMIVGASASRTITENCSSLQLAIRLNDINNSQILIQFVGATPIDKASEEYKKLKDNLKEACSVIEYILNNRDLQNAVPTEMVMPKQESSKLEQLKEYKNMLNEGLLTIDEYNKLKQQLLSL
jgi:energy-coupling factor transporter transmembrane protein EcfT